jgi:hypothetical protein
MSNIQQEMKMASDALLRRVKRYIYRLTARLRKGEITPMRALELKNQAQIRFDKQADDIYKLTMAKMLTKFEADLDNIFPEPNDLD